MKGDELEVHLMVERCLEGKDLIFFNWFSVDDDEVEGSLATRAIEGKR